MTDPDRDLPEPAQPPPWAGGTTDDPTGPERRSILVALTFVVILAGAAIFAAGFSLGLRQGTPGSGDALGAFIAAWRAIGDEYVGEVDEERLVQGAIRGLFDALGDDYSSYLPPAEYDEGLDDLDGQFEGIGAVVRSETADGADCEPLGETCFLIVEEPVPGAPAEKAGILPRDRFLAVDDVSVDGQTTEEVISRVRGPRGTEVRLTILRGTDELEIVVVRDVIRSDEVREEILADGQVGLVRIDGFSGSAEADFRETLTRLLDGGVRGLIIDLRDDPGGYVDAATGIASELIASGPILWEEDASGRQTATNASGSGQATDPSLPVVVLVNGGTASASEILAGALQDTGRATIVGETTFGKGTVQQWRLLPGENGGYRLSVAKWLTPARRWIHRVGIAPDVVVPAASSGATGDPQLERALAIVEEALGSGASPEPAGSPVASPSPRPS